ncbi:MAG: tRNA uridine-5-carboxymethylaminomethyl(34) synthesis GTPase MnmE [Candidatus Omnitrophica bacterium]|nr:tRNA uridine-5-carboxymethylaminomethyl(34) synthesis GTPase MnmE [Candidatus Omnitrophota bacterium]
MTKDGLLDTIAAVATSVGVAGIGIVRISGKDALVIADKIFVPRDKTRVFDFKAYTLHYGWIVHPSEKTIVDEVLLGVMRAPRSYTREDVVEINCHGGIVAVRAVLELALENGCRLANPGEFTKRAFLNGRIDLSQAEAVLDIIQAKTDAALKLGSEQLRGTLSAGLKKIRKIILDQLVVLEANIDFPEEEIGSADLRIIRKRLGEANSLLKDLLYSSGQGRIMREGISVVICGKPNAGKSSLLNALLKQERSIVTAVAGTTRDTIEEIIDIQGIPVRIVDTAGILEPRDLVEKKAIQRTKRYIDLADLVIVIFDGSRSLSADDRLLIKRVKNKLALAVINKIDLLPKINEKAVQVNFKQTIRISAKKMRNIGLLEEAIAELVYKGRLRSTESILVSNIRHIEKIKKAQKLIAESLSSLDNKISIEFVSQNIKDAIGYLDDILGKKFSEDLLDRIFSRFCIGK